MKRMLLKNPLWLGLFALILTSSLLYGDKAPADNKNQTLSPASSMGDPGTMTDEMTNIPFFSEADGMLSVLTLNNNKTTDTQVTVTLFDMEGNPSPLPAITLKAGSITNFPLKGLLKRAGQSLDSGSIEIMYQGSSMSVTAQVGVFDPNARISFESREVDMMDFMSSKMNAIVWIPEPDAQAFLALNNTAANTVHVHYLFNGEKHELSLRSHQTRLLYLNEHCEQHGAKGNLLHVEHDGVPGTVIGTGYVVNRGNGYSSSFILTDPSTAESNHLAGAHVRFGLSADSEGFIPGTKFKAPLVIANVSEQPVNVNVSVDYTKDSEFADVAVAKLQLAPNEVKQLDLTDKMADLGVYGPIAEAGVDISYDGTMGSVLASLTSYDLSGDYSFEVPVKDPADMSHMSQGSYPWTLEGGTKTVLHLKNATDKPQQASVLIRFSSGMYKPDLLKFKPYQTISVDIAKLKKSKQKDVDGKEFPLDANSGTVVWSEVTPKTMIGRAEQLNVAQGIARSFSCGGCPCPSNISSSSMSPGSFTSDVGYGGTPFTPVYQTEDCQGWFYGPYTASPTSWSSGNTSIATVSNTGIVDLNEAGSTSITAQFQSTVYSPPYCYTQTVNPTPSAPVNSRPTISGSNTLWWFKGIDLGVSGYPNQVTLTANPSSGSSFTWTIVSGSDKVQLSGSSALVTVTSIGQSTTANDVSITVTVGAQTSTPFKLTVKAPYALGTDPNQRTPVYSADPTFVWDTDIYYRILDNFLTPLPVGVSINESFPSPVVQDYAGNNWRQGGAACDNTENDVTFLDHIGGENSDRTPTPVYNPSWTGVAVQHWAQDWRVGSCVIGFGPRVQSDTLQKWTDHALHTGITTPNP